MANGDAQQQLEREFTAAGIDFTAPGFSDSQAFMAAEANDPALLLKYGRYVRGRSLDDAYRDRVRRRVRELADFITPELARDGRLGACIDVSGVAFKFLDREGIWGYAAVGSLVVDFVNPPGRRRILHHFMHPSNSARAGHAWLCVRPFDIVDLTVQAQTGFTAEERTRLAPVLAEGVPTEAAVTVDELAEPELLALFRRERGRAGRMEDFVTPALRDYWANSPARIATTPTVRLKYIECGVIAGDGAPLEDMQNLVLCGRGPGALHIDLLAQHPRA
jgi:hypothetical protein